MVDVPDSLAAAHERIVEGRGYVVDGRGRYAPGKMLEPLGCGAATQRFVEHDCELLAMGAPGAVDLAA
jgi:hypothetical protein